MRAGAQARTIFAGLGVTGCLIGAVGAIFAIAGGVLAFQGWPDAPSTPAPTALNVAAARSAATPQKAAALQLAPTPAIASATAGATTRRAHGRRSVQSVGVRPAGRGSGPLTGSGPTGTAVPTPGPASPAPRPATESATGLRATADAASRTIRAVGTAVPAAAPVANLVADTVDQVGRLLPGSLGRLSGQR